MVLPPRIRRSMSNTSVLTSPGTATIDASSAAPSPDTMSVEPQAAGADLGEVMVEPIGERGVDIDEFARGIDREEPARRMVEIFDRMLQLLKHMLLPLAVAGDVGNRPYRIFRLALARAEWPHP